jgi:hypothetical protein
MKHIKYLILTLILFIGINVYAEGPQSDGYIKYGDEYLYNSGEVYNGAVEGFLYNPSENKLTIDSVNSQETTFSIYNMGDLIIEFSGTNTFFKETFAKIFSTNNTNIIMQGDGSITVAGGKFLISDSNVEIKDVTININGEASVVEAYGDVQVTDARINLNSTKYHAAGVAGRNVYLNNVTMTGYVGLTAILAINSLSIENSNINVASISRGYYATIHSGADININESAIIVDKDAVSDLMVEEDQDYNIAIFAGSEGKGNLTIENSNIMIKDYTSINVAGDLSIVNSAVNLKHHSLPVLGKLSVVNSNVDIAYYGIGLLVPSLDMQNNAVMENGVLFENSVVTIKPAGEEFKAKYIKRAELDSNNYHLAPVPFVTLSNITLNNDDIIEGGSIYSACGNINGLDTCARYISNEEVNSDSLINYINSYGNSSESDIANLSGLSKTIVISRPEEKQETSNIIDVIKNVPNTGIATFIGVILGIGILGCGIYLVIKANKKETI